MSNQWMDTTTTTTTTATTTTTSPTTPTPTTTTTTTLPAPPLPLCKVVQAHKVFYIGRQKPDGERWKFLKSRVY